MFKTRESVATESRGSYISPQPDISNRDKAVRPRSQSGRFVGGGYRRLNEGTVEIAPGQLFFMHTDGVAIRVDVSAYDIELHEDLDKLAMATIEDWA